MGFGLATRPASLFFFYSVFRLPDLFFPFILCPLRGHLGLAAALASPLRTRMFSSVYLASVLCLSFLFGILELVFVISFFLFLLLGLRSSLEVRGGGFSSSWLD